MKFCILIVETCSLHLALNILIIRYISLRQEIGINNFKKSRKDLEISEGYGDIFLQQVKLIEYSEYFSLLRKDLQNWESFGHIENEAHQEGRKL